MEKTDRGRTMIGAAPVQRYNVTLPPEVAEALRQAGGGNLSAGIRRAQTVDDAATVACEDTALRAQLANTHRVMVLEAQQHKRAHAEVLRLAERLRKYEPGKPMILASGPNVRANLEPQALRLTEMLGPNAQL